MKKLAQRKIQKKKMLKPITNDDEVETSKAIVEEEYLSLPKENNIEPPY